MLLLTLAFVAAGLAKQAGVQMMVDEFARLGFDHWFRYVTGIIEIGSAVLLWAPAYGAGLLVCTIVGACEGAVGGDHAVGQQGAVGR